MNEQPCEPEAKDSYEKLLNIWQGLNSSLFKVSSDGIQNINEFFEVVEKFFEAWTNRGTKPSFVYRGESNTYKTFLMSTIFRNMDKEKITLLEMNSNFTKQEYDEILEFQETEIGKSILENGQLSKDACDWIPLAQHYGRKTRLLDVTKNSLTALYFACEKNFNRDSWVFIINVGSLRTQTKPLDEVQKYDIEQGIPNTYHQMFDSCREKIPHFFNFDVPVYKRIVYRKIIAQSAAFIWWEPFWWKPWGPYQFFPILINKNSKEQILNKLDVMVNINRKELFPD